MGNKCCNKICHANSWGMNVSCVFFVRLGLRYFFRFAYPYLPPPYSVKCWQKWKGLGKVIYTLIQWMVMFLYQLQIYKIQVAYSLLASYILYKYTFLKMYIHQPCARRAHRNRPTYIHPPSVGMIYPISTYIFN